MLINLSNHPSSKWKDAQLQTAQEQFDRVMDLPFPSIDPNWTQSQVHKLAEDFFEQIIAYEPGAVHLMGEMTFSFALIQKLKKAGVKCVASTTLREIDESEGAKTVYFKFVQFREY